jgi:hypothetical protein
MNWQGWIFMLIVWGLVGCLFFYSFYHILFDERIQDKRIQNKRKKRSKK